MVALATRAQAGHVIRATIQSTIIGSELPYVVVIPDTYDQQVTAGKRFPVVYLLHCAGCNSENWVTDPFYCPSLDNLIDSVGFIAVALDDEDRFSWWLDSPVRENSDFSRYLAEEIVPLIDSLYATSPHRRHRGLMGHSMGGYGAMHNLIEHPDLFASAFSVKGAVDLLPYDGRWGLSEILGYQATHFDNWLAADVVTHACSLAHHDVSVAFYSGPNDWFYDGNMALHDTLEACGVPHWYYTTEEMHFSVPDSQMPRIMAWFDSVFTPSTAVGGERHGARSTPETIYTAMPGTPEGAMLNARGQKVRGVDRDRTATGTTAAGVYIRLHRNAAVPARTVHVLRAHRP
jgi:enterochelin esterase-like enzyme